MLKAVLQVALLLVGFVAILYLAYLTSRFVGKSHRFRAKSGGNIEILQTVAIGSDRQLMIARVCGKLMLLGVTESAVSLITELDAQQLVTEPEQPAAGMPFKDALFKTINERLGKDKPAPQDKPDEE
ncbi:MAG: flagellar biosynthetic protein FliO [Oscillospiraceae bacterium]